MKVELDLELIRKHRIFAKSSEEGHGSVVMSEFPNFQFQLRLKFRKITFLPKPYKI